jgi:hypothetical protein
VRGSRERGAKANVSVGLRYPADLEKAIRAALNKPGRTEGVRKIAACLSEDLARDPVRSRDPTRSRTLSRQSSSIFTTKRRLASYGHCPILCDALPAWLMNRGNRP